MRLEDITSSKPVTQLGLYLAQSLPPRLGYAFVRAVVWLITVIKPRLYFIVRKNLHQVMNQKMGQADLNALTHRLFLHAGMTYYDFFHAVGKSPERIAKMMPIPSSVLDQIQAMQAEKRGVLILGMHLSNFDLALISFGAHGLPVQALSLANPQPGFHILNELRARSGFEITPICPESLRQAIRNLKGGGYVITGMDWPVPNDQALIPFFGREAYLPLGPARLALLSRAVVFLAACHHTPEYGYAIDVIGPIEMLNSGNRQEDIYHNTCRFANFMEEQVRMYPEQWMMFHPFWPENGKS